VHFTLDLLYLVFLVTDKYFIFLLNMDLESDREK